jgi:hypothetical protein
VMRGLLHHQPARYHVSRTYTSKVRIVEQIHLLLQAG